MHLASCVLDSALSIKLGKWEYDVEVLACHLRFGGQMKREYKVVLCSKPFWWSKNIEFKERFSEWGREKRGKKKSIEDNQRSLIEPFNRKQRKFCDPMSWWDLNSFPVQKFTVIRKYSAFELLKLRKTFKQIMKDTVTLWCYGTWELMESVWLQWRQNTWTMYLCTPM